MKTTSKLLMLAVVVAVPAMVAGHDEGRKQKDQAANDGTKMMEKGRQAAEKHRQWLDAHMEGWPQSAREAAALTMESYGQPAAIADDRIYWTDVEPWKRIVVFREEITHNFPMPHKDVLEQFIDYKVPADKFDELAEFDGSVIAERTWGVLSARCGHEAANFLALNLANDVVMGAKSVEEARDYYAQAIEGMLNGETDPYMERLRFDMGGNTADPDEERFENPMASRAALTR